MPVRKHTESDIRKWAKHYGEVFSICEVSRNFGVHKSIISTYFKKYKSRLGIKFKEEFQKELLDKGQRLCLPVTGCGIIKDISGFCFRNDSGKYKEQCKSCRTKYNKKWCEDNKEYLSKYGKKYGKENRKRLSSYEKERRKNDIQFRLIANIRSRMNNALCGQIKTATAKEYLGCSVFFLKKHLESQFYYHHKTGEVMSWENYGFRGWHIDHIKPLSSFDLSKKNQFFCR